MTAMETGFPKEIPIARFSRKKRLAQIVIKAKDVTGAMAEISSILTSQGVDVRQSSAFVVERERYYVYNAFVWLTKEGYRLEDLVAKLRASNYVLDVVAKEGVEGSVTDTIAFPLQFSGERVVVLETRAVADMFEALDKVFGSGSSVIIKEQGFNYGRAMTAEMAKLLTKPYMVRNFRYGMELFKATGWGIISVLEANQDLTQVRVRVDESFECERRRSKRPCGYFTSGFVAGVFSFLSGKELQGVETFCVATGQDHCEITVSEKPR